MKTPAKYASCRQLAIVNQIDIVNNRKGYSIGYKNIKPIISLMFSIVFAFALISLSSDSVVATPELRNAGDAEFNIQELYNTQNSGRIIREKNIATATGVGRILDDTVQSRLLGRRAALLDARRNLLILRASLLEERRAVGNGTHGVSGRIAGVRIHSERVKDGLYFLQVDIPLDELMEGEIEIVE